MRQENSQTVRVVQHDDQQWTVREVDARVVPGSLRPTCLICESPDVIRRLWLFPKDWWQLDDDAVWRLCEGID